MGLFISHLISYLRPSDLQLVSVPREIARELPRKLQRLLGYYPFGNGVDGLDPLDTLHDGVVVHPEAVSYKHWRVVRTQHMQSSSTTMETDWDT